MRLLRDLTGWALALFLIFMFVQATIHPLPNPPAGMVKLLDAPGENIVFATLAAKTQVAWLEPSGRVLVAIAELVVCIFLLIPPFRRFGAILSFILLAAAVGAHMSPDILGRELPLSLTGSPAGTDGGQLFALAIGMLAASLLLIVVHPGRMRY